MHYAELGRTGSDKNKCCSHKDLLHKLLEALGIALRVHRRYAVAIIEDCFVAVLYPFAHIVLLHMTLCIDNMKCAA